MDEDESFGKWLRKLRKSKDLTQRELAKELDIKHSYLSQLEKDIVKPSMDLAKRIAKFFDQDEEKMIFYARGIQKVIDDIKEQFPNIAPGCFRRALKKVG